MQSFVKKFMKIAFFLSASNTKGSNGVFLELIDSLSSSKFDFFVVLPSAGPITKELEKRRIPFKVFTINGGCTKKNHRNINGLQGEL